MVGPETFTVFRGVCPRSGRSPETEDEAETEGGVQPKHTQPGVDGTLRSVRNYK